MSPMSRTEVAINTSHLSGLSIGDPALLSLLNDEAFAEAWQARHIIKKERDRCVAIIRAEDARDYLIKSRAPGFTKRIVGRVTRPLASVHRNLEFLSQHGVPVARGLAYFCWRDADQPERWCQIQEYVPAAETLEQVLRELQGAEDADKLSRLVCETARQLGRIHQLGRYHGDMKLTNVLVREGKIILIDIEGGRPLRRQRWQQKDLGRFLVGLMEVGVSHAHIQEAIAVYRQQSGNGDKKFMNAAERFAEKISRRRRRRYGSQLTGSPQGRN